MKITTSEIRNSLKKVWAKLDFIVFTDPFFYKWTEDELNNFVKISNAGQNKFIENFNACEEAMLEMVLDAKRVIFPTGDVPGNKAMFCAFAMRTKITNHLLNAKHWLCIACTEDGLKMVDPRSKFIWSPTDEDEIIFLFG